MRTHAIDAAVNVLSKPQDVIKSDLLLAWSLMLLMESLFARVVGP